MSSFSFVGLYVDGWFVRGLLGGVFVCWYVDAVDVVRI